MNFFYVYKALAHPEKDGWIQPLVIEERLAHIARARSQLGTRIPWLADNMSNDLKHAFGDRNNSEFVISPEGEILVARSWSNPEELRSDLEKWVGKPETRTRISELGRPVRPVVSAGKAIARGVVERVPRPDGSEPLTVTSVHEEGTPLYLKLRAEAPLAVSRGGDGAIHLAFYMDPIHEVHWNNLAAPMTYSIAAEDGLTVTPVEGEAVNVTAAEADLDPREFLLSLKRNGSDENDSFLVTVDYFACDDADRWCKAASQDFKVTLAINRDAGRVQKRGGATVSRKGKGSAPGEGKGRLEAGEVFERMDNDGDDTITKAEARGPLSRLFDEIDSNGDGSLSRIEIRARFSNR
ncbi:MAG: hypothetical protein AAGC68_04470 [Verrucomicrobiota bacterium]